MQVHLSSLVAILAVPVAMAGCVVERGPGSRQPVYSTCGTTNDCELAADACYTITNDGVSRGMCSMTCASDSQCTRSSTGEPGACYDVMGSGVLLCYERCFTDADCAAGFGCIATDAGDAICLPGRGSPPPPPPSENYAQCAVVTDCNTLAEDCYYITYGGITDGLCTSQCASDASCVAGVTGESGACYDVMGSGVLLCYERCFSNADCPGGYLCFDTFDPGTGVADAICLPG
jgi:hypothetical protein